MSYRLPSLKLIAAGLLFLSLSGCKIYSFTGASVSPDIKTVTILNFLNQSENGNTAVSQDLADQLKDKFLTETNLKLVNNDGDIEFMGIVTGYSIRAQAGTADQSTAQNRLTITVRVEYVNRKNEKENWSQTFTRYNDYPSATNLADVELQLVSSINQQLAEDIFNKAFVNW